MRSSGIKPIYISFKNVEFSRDLPSLNSCMYVPSRLSNPRMHEPFRLSNLCTHMQLLNYSFTAHQTFRTNPSLDIHNKKCVGHKYYTNKPIINMVILDLLDLIDDQYPGCTLGFRSNNLLIAHYIHTYFGSNYS